MLSFSRTTNLNVLEEYAKRTRLEVYRFKTTSGYGHLASCLSVVDILTSIYLDSESKFDIEHDRLIFSKGHGSPAVYPILVGLQLIPEKELDLYCKKEGILRLHADYSIPGCFFVGGSLGNGIGFAAGLAIARPWQNFYVILGDAELYEGSVWESLLFISHHNLKNIILIIDRNKYGILGATEQMIQIEPLEEKFQSFKFQVHRTNGHDLVELRKFFGQTQTHPRVLIADTIKGKGVSFMEDRYEYHTIIPSDPVEIRRGLSELL